MLTWRGLHGSRFLQEARKPGCRGTVPLGTSGQGVSLATCSALTTPHPPPAHDQLPVSHVLCFQYLEWFTWAWLVQYLSPFQSHERGAGEGMCGPRGESA